MAEGSEESGSSFDFSDSKLCCDDENELCDGDAEVEEDADAIRVNMLEISSGGSDSECSLSQEEKIWNTSADDSGTEVNDIQ